MVIDIASARGDNVRGIVAAMCRQQVFIGLQRGESGVDAHGFESAFAFAQILEIGAFARVSALGIGKRYSAEWCDG